MKKSLFNPIFTFPLGITLRKGTQSKFQWARVFLAFFNVWDGLALFKYIFPALWNFFIEMFQFWHNGGCCLLGFMLGLNPFAGHAIFPNLVRGYTGSVKWRIVDVRLYEPVKNMGLKGLGLVISFCPSLGIKTSLALLYLLGMIVWICLSLFSLECE